MFDDYKAKFFNLGITVKVNEMSITFCSRSFADLILLFEQPPVSRDYDKFRAVGSWSLDCQR